MKISKNTAESLMDDAFANVYMDTHEPTGDYEIDKDNIENAILPLAICLVLIK